MSSKEAGPQPRNDQKEKKDEQGAEATQASQSWMGQKLDRWLGHSARTIGGEILIGNGLDLASKGALHTFGYASATTTIIAPHSLAIAATALGGAITVGGAWAEWHWGMKNAKSKLEKGAFWLAKAGQVAAPLITFYLPAYTPVAWGLYGAGVAAAFRGMTHRPEGGKKAH